MTRRVTRRAAGQPDLALVQDAWRRLREVGDPGKAPAMQAYMKSVLPYHGVPAPLARVVFREVLAAHPLADRPTWLATVHALWDGATHREERYAALAVVRDRRYAGYRDPEELTLYRHLLTTGAWWDVVDDVATHLVGPLLLDHPDDAVRPTLCA